MLSYHLFEHISLTCNQSLPICSQGRTDRHGTKSLLSRLFSFCSLSTGKILQSFGGNWAGGLMAGPLSVLA